MTEPEQEQVKRRPAAPPSPTPSRSRRWSKLVLALVVVLILAAGGEALWHFVSAPRSATFAWELKAPEGETWFAMVAGAEPNYGTAVGQGQLKSAMWIDSAGKVICSSPVTDKRGWRGFIYGQPEARYGFYQVDAVKNTLEIIQAGAKGPVTVDLAQVPVTAASLPLKRIQVSAGDDGMLYAALSNLDLAVISPTGEVVRQIALDSPITSLRGVRPGGTLLGYTSAGEICCYTAQGRTQWRHPYPKGSYVVSAEDPDGGMSLKVDNKLVKLGADGKQMWELDVITALGMAGSAAESSIFYALKSGTWMGHCADRLFGVDASGKLAWNLDFYKAKGYFVVDAEVDQGQPGGGLILLLYRPDRKTFGEEFRRMTSGTRRTFIKSTHIARVTAQGKVAGVWRLPAGDYHITGTGAGGETYLEYCADPINQQLLFTLRRIDLK